jgi:hypothetical protein
MQTTHTHEECDLHGSFKHIRTLSIRRRPGMPGAYVRLKIAPVGFTPVKRYDSGWLYHNTYDALVAFCKRQNRDLFTVLLPE